MDLSDQLFKKDELSQQQARHSRNQASSAELARAAETIRTLQQSLQAANSKVEGAEARMTTLQRERASVAHEVAEFEADLRSQREESKRFGVQLQLLKSEQLAVATRNETEVARLERECRKGKERLDATTRELRDCQNDYSEIRRWRDVHECNS